MQYAPSSSWSAPRMIAFRAEFRHDYLGKPLAKYLYGIKEHLQHKDLAGKDLSSYLRETINFVGFNF